MRRIAFLLVLFAASPAAAADLPPGAIARLGDDRFRAGSHLVHIAISPDGKQFATVRWTGVGLGALTLWDAATGRPIRGHELNDGPFGGGLFKGFVWGPGGGFAVFIRAEAGKGEEDPAKVFHGDFRVWDFTDPKAKSPPVLVPVAGAAGSVTPMRPDDSPEYIDFCFSADARRVAALWNSADRKKNAVHVFELKAAEIAEKLKRVGTIDLGAEAADSIRLSPDGKTLVTFRNLANPDARECAATAWDVATGLPGKPVRVSRSYPHAPTLTPNGRELVEGFWTEKEQGYNLVDLSTGKRKKVTRLPEAVLDDEPDDIDGLDGRADSVFLSPGNVLVEPGRPSIVLDLATGRPLGRLKGHLNTPSGVAVSADGSRIVTADSSGLIRLWDAKTLRPLNDAPGHRAAVSYAQFSPDGKRLLTWAPDKAIWLWDVATGKELRAFYGATDDFQPVFARNGTTVVYSTKKSLVARDLQTGLEVPLPENAKKIEPQAAIHSTAWMSAAVPDSSTDVLIHETASNTVRRTLRGHRGEVRVLGLTPDGTKLLTAGGDHTVLVWDMRLAHVPLPDALKKETSAAKLWNTLAVGNAKDAYLAMARLAREPEAAVKMAKLKLKPVAKAEAETDSSKLADARAIELLEALETDASRMLLKELADGHADAFRTQEAKRALERQKAIGYNAKDK
jgi:WD40 repeat protein